MVSFLRRKMGRYRAQEKLASKQEKPKLAGESTNFMASVANLSQVYPAPLRYHIDVVMNPDTFRETLISFHSSMGTRFMNPVIGGENLDLYRLYFLVTQRGGIEKTLLDGRWSEVIAELNIPHSITNRSFVVKKHYMKLLFHYEQVYLFRRQGPTVSPPEILLPRKRHGRFVYDLNLNMDQGTLQSPQPINDQGSQSSASTPDNLVLGENQPQTDANGIAKSGDTLSDSATLKIGQPIEEQPSPSSVAAGGDATPIPTNMDAPLNEGTMEAGSGTMLDHGDIVPVTVGSQAFHGMLNHIQPLLAENYPLFSLSAPVTPVARPKPCRNAYNIFFEEKYSAIRNLSPQSTRKFVKLIEESWDNLTEDEKGAYEDKEKMDRERYRREMQEYGQGMRIMRSREPARASTVERQEH